MEVGGRRRSRKGGGRIERTKNEERAGWMKKEKIIGKIEEK